MAMTYDRETAVEMIAAIICEHNLFDASPGGDGSPMSRSRSEAADLLFECESPEDEGVDNVSLVVNIISDLLDRVEERDGMRPDMPQVIHV